MKTKFVKQNKDSHHATLFEHCTVLKAAKRIANWPEFVASCDVTVTGDNFRWTFESLLFPELVWNLCFSLWLAVSLWSGADHAQGCWLTVCIHTSVVWFWLRGTEEGSICVCVRYYCAHFCTHFIEFVCTYAVCKTTCRVISIAAAGCVVYKPQKRFYHTLYFTLLILVDTYALQHTTPTLSDIL